MAISIKIEKKDLWLFAAIMVFSVGVAYVIAFGDYSGNEAQINGHSSDEVMIKNSSGSLISLQDYIDQESIPRLGTWSAKGSPASGGADENLVKDHVYVAKTNGFAVISSADENSNSLYGYTDSTNPPVTVRCNGVVHNGGAYGLTSCTMPVRKGDYWKVTGGIVRIYWIPLN
jgi:hypothetical protein